MLLKFYLLAKIWEIEFIIWRSGSGRLILFELEEIQVIELFDKRNKPYLKDFVDGKDRPTKPEEIVRQLDLYRLIHTYGYPVDPIRVEKAVYFGSTVAKKKADIVFAIATIPIRLILSLRLKSRSVLWFVYLGKTISKKYNQIQSFKRK